MLVTQRSFCEGSSGDLEKRRLFSQAIKLPKVVLTFESVNHKLTSLQMKADDKQPFVVLILCFCDHRNGAHNSVCYLTEMKFVLHLLGVIRAVMIGLKSAKTHLQSSPSFLYDSPSFLPRNMQARKCACAGESCRETHEHAKMPANTVFLRGYQLQHMLVLFSSTTPKTRRANYSVG